MDLYTLLNLALIWSPIRMPFLPQLEHSFTWQVGYSIKTVNRERRDYFLFLLTLRRFANSLASLFTDPLFSLQSPSSAKNLLSTSARGARSLSQEAKKSAPSHRVLHWNCGSIWYFKLERSGLGRYDHGSKWPYTKMITEAWMELKVSGARTLSIPYFPLLVS